MATLTAEDGSELLLSLHPSNVDPEWARVHLRITSPNENYETVGEILYHDDLRRMLTLLGGLGEPRATPLIFEALEPEFRVSILVSATAREAAVRLIYQERGRNHVFDAPVAMSSPRQFADAISHEAATCLTGLP